MITARQLSEALYGIWLLLKFDPRGFDYFDATPGGFARSFLPAAVTAPFQLAHYLLVYPNAKAELSLAPFLVVQTLSFVLGWVLFPFMMLYVSDLLGRRERYFHHLVPYNWIQLPITLPLYIVLLLMDVKLLSVPVYSVFVVTATTLVFVYGTLITRFGLQIGYGTAVGVMLLNIMLSMMQSYVIALI